MVCGYSQVKECEVRTVRGAHGCDITLKVLQELFNYACSALWLLFFYTQLFSEQKICVAKNYTEGNLAMWEDCLRSVLTYKRSTWGIVLYVFYEQCLYTNTQLKEWTLKCFKFFLLCENRKIISSIFVKCMHCFKRKVLVRWLLADSHIFCDVFTK
jgi:hypothetical protein